MQKNNHIWLILAILLALTVTWIHNLWQSQQQFIAKIDKTRVDYYLSDFSLLITDNEGQMRYSLQANHFVHHVESKQSDIYFPMIQAKQNDENIMIESEKATQLSNGDIELTGEVSIKKPESAQREGYTLITENLRYAPSMQTIETQNDFTFATTGGTLMRGTGVTEELNNQVLRIKSNVHAEFQPPDNNNNN